MADSSSIGRFFPDNLGPAQRPADVAVVMTTVVRSSLERALRSVFAQTFKGRVQIALGVDVLKGDGRLVAPLIEARPATVSVLFLALPYSTSMRHGGVHRASDGGALRSILTYAANSYLIAYLDDDNEWRPDHLQLLHKAIAGNTWAFSQRVLVDEETDRDVGVDRWHSTGPDRGVLPGGFVDPNCMMIDKTLAPDVPGLWSSPDPSRPNDSADRRVFEALRRRPMGEVQQPTVRYRIRRTNVLWLALQEGVGITT